MTLERAVEIEATYPDAGRSDRPSVGVSSTEERFWAKVSKGAPNQCWLWLGSKTKGYGKLGLPGRRTVYAHRFAWELANGQIPDGMTVDHLCFVADCVNPSYLRLLTKSENSRNQRRALADECRRGHKYTQETTRYRQRGPYLLRQCRECERVIGAKRNERRRAGAAA